MMIVLCRSVIVEKLRKNSPTKSLAGYTVCCMLTRRILAWNIKGCQVHSVPFSSTRRTENFGVFDNQDGLACRQCLWLMDGSIARDTVQLVNELDFLNFLAVKSAFDQCMWSLASILQITCFVEYYCFYCCLLCGFTQPLLTTVIKVKLLLPCLVYMNRPQLVDWVLGLLT
jgi:hypothetical protein